MLDITIIKPIIEACTGEDLLTGEDLSDLERGLKVVFAIVDLATIGGAVAATKLSEMELKKALQTLGKTVSIEFAANTTVCGVGALGEAFDWPIPITIMLSLATGITVSCKGNKLLFEGEGFSREILLDDVDVEKIGEMIDGGTYSSFGEMTFKDGKQYSAWNKLREEGLTFEQAEKIKYIEKGKKPTPETYLSNEYIQNHLQSFKDSGAVKIMPNKPSGTIGGKGGTFVMSGDELDEIIQYANGDISKIEDVLGFEPGYLGENPVIVMMDDASNVRMPSGNELGAWPEYWEPGGYTSGGIKEAVIDPVPEGEYTYKFLLE